MSDQANGGMQVDPDLVRQLAELLDANQLTEIEVQDGARRIRVARTIPAQAAPPLAAPAPAAPAAAPAHALVPAPDPAAPPIGEHPGTIRSPMVGTAYLASEPGARPFASIGAQVMNPIVSPRAGTVRAVFVESGQPVEFDQPLVVVE